MAKLFGFVQFELAGTLPLADGRYLAAPGTAVGGEEWVLAVNTLGAPAPEERRRRRRGRGVEADPAPPPIRLTRVTAIRASAPLASQTEAARWLDQTCAEEAAVEALAAEAIAPLNRALHAHAVAAGDPYGRELAPEHAERVLVGYGSGEETADGRFSDARQVDLAPRSSSRRRRREEQLQPQERVAGVLRGRERLDACETLLLRARADLEAGRDREAALQLRVGLEALLIELDGTVDDPGHERDMESLREQQPQVVNAAKAALGGAPTEEQKTEVEQVLAICERVLRRRRVLRG